jgi:hypothetical protein
LALARKTQDKSEKIRTMTATPADPRPDPAIPAPYEVAKGAGSWRMTPWRIGPYYERYRSILGREWTITDAHLNVWTEGAQWEDGRIDAPSVRLSGGVLGELNSDQARELAAALLEAATEIDALTSHVAGVDKVAKP